MAARYEYQTEEYLHIHKNSHEVNFSGDTEHTPDHQSYAHQKQSAANQALQQQPSDAAGFIKHWNPAGLQLSLQHRSISDNNASPQPESPPPITAAIRHKAAAVEVIQNTEFTRTSFVNGETNPGQLCTQFDFHHGVHCFALSPDGCSIAVHTGGGSVLIVEVATGTVSRRLNFNSRQDSFISWSPDGRCVAAVHRIHVGEIQVWDVEEQQTQVFNSWKGYKMFCWSPCGLQICAITSDNDEAVLLDLTADTDPKPVSCEGERVDSVSWSPQGETVAVSACGCVGLWNPCTLVEEGGQNFFEFDEHPKLQTPCSCAWSPDSSMMMCWGTSLMIWNGITAEKWTVHDSQSKGRVYSAAWSPDSGYIATGSENGMLRIWRVDTGAEKLVLEFSCYGSVGRVLHLAWSPCGRNIFATVSRHVLIYSVFSNRLV